MPKKQGSLVFDILDILFELSSDLFEMVPYPLETPYNYVRRVRNLELDRYYSSVRGMKRTGYIKVSKTKDGTIHVSLTRKGALEILFHKAQISKHEKWNGK